MGMPRDRVVVVTEADRVRGPSTPGMERQQAFATEDLWAGFIRTDPDSVSGWHHHGAYDTVIYVLSGSLVVEFGAAGSDSVSADPGDFVHVPRGVVHRERNPSSEPADLVGVRVGRGESTINVEGPSTG
jgi:uncharacterized RmlC-like cupin family protein